jgi:hypothetical protein
MRLVMKPGISQETRALFAERARDYQASLSPEERSRRSSIRGNAVLRRYGVGYFAAMGLKSARIKKNGQASQETSH